MNIYANSAATLFLVVGAHIALKVLFVAAGCRALLLVHVGGHGVSWFDAYAFVGEVVVIIVDVLHDLFGGGAECFFYIKCCFG